MTARDNVRRLHIAQQALAGHGTAMTGTAELRRAMRKAGFGGTAAFTVYNALCGLADKRTGIIPASRQPTFRGLQDLCGGLASQTLRDALDHLEHRHPGWVTRWQAAGYARRTYYAPGIGEPCNCRPGRGHPMSDAERKRKQRRNVTLTQSTNVTANRSTIPGACHTDERDIPQVDAAKPIGVNVSHRKTTVTGGSGSAKDTPQEGGSHHRDSWSQATGTSPVEDPAPVGAKSSSAGDEPSLASSPEHPSSAGAPDGYTGRCSQHASPHPASATAPAGYANDHDGIRHGTFGAWFYSRCTCPECCRAYYIHYRRARRTA